MTLTDYKSIARSKRRAERPRLVSYWGLAAVAVLVLVPLVVAFPGKDLLREVEQQPLGDELSTSYLTNLLKSNPDNQELRVLLAEHRIYRGELADIPALLNPVLHSTNAAWQAKASLAFYKYLAAEYELAEPGSRRQAELMKRRRALFVRLAARTWSIDTLVYLAGEAPRVNEHDAGMRIYRSLIESPGTSAAWCATAAARVLGEGAYELAAQLYFSARHKESSVPKQREYLMAGIRALMAKSLFTEAMEAADEHVGNLRTDPDTLTFLIQAARAANDQKRAARYARWMLHLSWLARAYVWFQGLDLGLLATASAATLGGTPAHARDAESYDDKKYQLAYQVFLENRNLADAFRVAETAVRHRPKDPLWHQRLAQVAEWVSKPQIALREWRWLLHHDGGEPALQAVLRLAPALDDYDAALEAWQIKAAHGVLNTEQWNTLAELFEKTGRQGDGIRFFERRYDSTNTPLMLEIAARLAQRMGDDEHAAHIYLRLLERHGFNSDWVLKTANLYLQKGHYRQAYDFLQKNRAHAAKSDSAYWKLLADLAWQLQRDVDAVKDYRRLAAAGNLAQEDIGRLITLLGDSKQEEAAALAELSFRKFGDAEMLYRALEIYAARHDLVAQRRLFDSVAANPKANVSDSSRFLLLRAQYLRACGAFQEAHAMFRRATALAPDDANTANAFLWFLIEAHDQAALRQMMAQIITRGDQQNPAYWGAFAAGYEVLDEPLRAVAYYGRELRQKEQDFLWLVNYAEALDVAQQPALAWQVRRYAWRQLRKRLHEKPLALPFSPDMLAAAQLEVMNQPGDPGSALVRSVLRQDRLVKQDPIAKDHINELVLGWAVSNEQSYNAKAWLWRRYARTLDRPVWGDAMVAMATNDTAHLNQLVADEADAMPMPVRHDAASAVDQPRYAQSIAFEALTGNPYDNEAHLRLAEGALAAAPFVNFQLRNMVLGTMHFAVQGALVEAPVAPHWRVGAEIWHTHQTDIEPLTLGIAPPTEMFGGVLVKHQDASSETEVAVRRRNEFASTTEAHVIHAMRILSDLHLKLAAEAHAEATESNNLRVFGMRNQAEATLDYAFTTREYLSMEPGYARYYTQTGNFLGTGTHLSWELGHHVSTTYPDWRVAVIGINERFQNATRTILPMPPNQNLYGACVGLVDDYQHTYTQAWRPYFDACTTRNSVSGKGYIGKIGLAGSVTGHDQINLSYRQEQGGVRVVHGLEREVRLNYRYFFDRY